MSARLYYLSSWVILLSRINPAFAQDWMVSSAPTNPWVAIAASADASKLVAVAGWGYIWQKRGIVISTNSGGAWHPASAPAEIWTSVACSADASVIVAGAIHDHDLYGRLYTSRDGGGTWITNNLVPRRWISVACSADGSRMFASSQDGWFYRSSNTGEVWSSMSAPFKVRAVTCSKDGNRILIASESLLPRALAATTNAGATWLIQSIPPAFGVPTSVAMSADGSLMTAIDGAGSNTGLILVSTNYGATWEKTTAPGATWQGVSCSADGSTLVATAHFSSGDPYGGLYTSIDSGRTWVSNSLPMKSWRGAACSADGTILVAVTQMEGPRPSKHDGQIWMLKTGREPKLTVTRIVDQFAVSWVVPTRIFKLQQGGDVNQTDWNEVLVPPVFDLANFQFRVELPSLSSNTFFRLRAE